MKNSGPAISLAAALLLSAFSGPALAQLSADEIKNRFNAHRGLQLAPVAPSATPQAPAEGTTMAVRPAVPAGSSTASAQPSVPRDNSAAPVRPASVTAAEIEAAAASYTAVPDDMRVDFQINFEFDSAVLRDSERAKLDTVCQAMRDSDVGTFHIFGHTDASGTREYNLTLSQLRADEVRRYLVASCGLPGDRLRAIGVGEEHLLETSDPRAPENRRVEFQAIG